MPIGFCYRLLGFARVLPKELFEPSFEVFEPSWFLYLALPAGAVIAFIAVSSWSFVICPGL